MALCLNPVLPFSGISPLCHYKFLTCISWPCWFNWGLIIYTQHCWLTCACLPLGYCPLLRVPTHTHTRHSNITLVVGYLRGGLASTLMLQALGLPRLVRIYLRGYQTAYSQEALSLCQIKITDYATAPQILLSMHYSSLPLVHFPPFIHLLWPNCHSWRMLPFSQGNAWWVSRFGKLIAPWNWNPTCSIVSLSSPLTPS